jgi:hypothetical protein
MDTRRPRLYLHIGTPKTGTTFLQDVCWRNRELLAWQGVLYPGDAWDSQYLGVLEVMSARFPDWRGAVVPGTWERIVGQVRAHHGTAIVSHELLCPASEQEAGRVLADLAFAEVHVVCTARNLASQIPSVWQEDVKNGHSFGFGEFLDGLRADPPAPGTMADVFWSFQDLPRILRTWTADLPADRLHLLTVPTGGGSGQLWGRFAGLLGLPADRFDTTAVQANNSLGAGEAELLRRINVALRGRLDNETYQTLVKDLIATETLAARSGKQPIVLPTGERGWVRARAERFVKEIEAAGYDVVGDLRDLVPAEQSADTRPPAAGDAEMVDAAVDSILVLLDRLADERQPVDPPRRLRDALLDIGRQAYAWGRTRVSRTH